MNPIIPMLFDDNKEAVVASNSSVADAETVTEDPQHPVINRYCEGDETETTTDDTTTTRSVDFVDNLQHPEEHSPEQQPPDDDSSDLGKEKSDPTIGNKIVEEKGTNSATYPHPKNSFSSFDELVVSPAPPVAPTNLSRQNIVRALQPGAFDVTPTRVSRVRAAHNRDRNDNDDYDIESNVSGMYGDTVSGPTGLIQAELVTSPSSAVVNPVIPRADEVVVDPSTSILIKQQLEAQQKQQEQLHLQNKSRMKWIFLAVGVLMVLVLCLVSFVVWDEFFHDQQSTSPLPSCNPNQVASVCKSVWMEENQQSSSPGSFNDTYYNETYAFTSDYSMEDHDAKVRDRLESEWNCIPVASYDVCRDPNKNRNKNNDRGPQHQSRSDPPCPYGSSKALEECPLRDNDKDMSQLCNDILAKIETYNGAMPADADYSVECAMQIARDCNDTYTVCDVWDDVFD
jgi:hypothetical protein